MKTCFVVSPIGDVGSEIKLMRISYLNISLAQFVKVVVLNLYA